MTKETLFAASRPADEREWKVATSERETAPNESVEHWQTVVENDETGERVNLHFAVFETRRATLRVIDQPDVPRRDLAEVMTQMHCLAGVNGGYFDPADAPVGLLVSEGHVIAPMRKARLLSGVLTATARRVDIVRATRFSIDERRSRRRCNAGRSWSSTRDRWRVKTIAGRRAAPLRPWTERDGPRSAFARIFRWRSLGRFCA